MAKLQADARTRWEVEELRRHLDEVSADSAKTAAALTAERKLREQLEADLIDAALAQRDRLIAQLRRELAAARRGSAPIAIETPFGPAPEAPSASRGMPRTRPR